MEFFDAHYERVGEETKGREVGDLRAMCARMPRDRSELLDDARVVEIMELHDGGAEANALRCIHGDNGSCLVARAREAALRGYHRAWGF